jgi:hypothetical protein
VNAGGINLHFLLYSLILELPLVRQSPGARHLGPQPYARELILRLRADS